MKYLNTTSGSEVILTEAVSIQNSTPFSTMSICNTSTNDAAVLDVYFKKVSGGTIFYIIKDVNIPPGINLYLDNKTFPKILSFNSKGYQLCVHNTGTNPSLTIIIK